MSDFMGDNVTEIVEKSENHWSTKCHCEIML